MLVIMFGRIFLGRSRLLVPSSSRQYAPIAKVEDGGGAVLFAGDEQHRDPEQDHEPQEREVELAEPEALCRTDEVVRHVRLAAGESVEDTEGHLPADDGYEDKEHSAHERPARRGEGAGHAVERGPL